MTREIRVQRASEVLPSGVPQRPAGGPLARPIRLRAEEVVGRLEAAGATLLAMPRQGYSTQLRQMNFDIVHTALEAYGWQAAAARPPVPSAAAISAMDEAFAWLSLIPEQKYLLRRILGARALVHPLTERHLFPWRRLAGLLGADHKSVQRWHAQGVALLVDRLSAGYELQVANSRCRRCGLWAELR
jgi:hypothetical protein